MGLAALLATVVVCAHEVRDTWSIPAKCEVGADAMPQVMDAVDEAPFLMKKLKRPTFPRRLMLLTTDDIAADGKITPRRGAARWWCPKDIGFRGASP